MGDFMEQELRFGLDLDGLATFETVDGENKSGIEWS